MRSKAEKYGTEKYRYSKSVTVLKRVHCTKFSTLSTKEGTVLKIGQNDSL